jgi:hypothetical protein
MRILALFLVIGLVVVPLLACSSGGGGPTCLGDCGFCASGFDCCSGICSLFSDGFFRCTPGFTIVC